MFYFESVCRVLPVVLYLSFRGFGTVSLCEVFVYVYFVNEKVDITMSVSLLPDRKPHP